MSEQETYLIQVRTFENDEFGPWQDYSRCTGPQAGQFMDQRADTPEGERFRVVDWISKVVLIPEWDLSTGKQAVYPDAERVINGLDSTNAQVVWSPDKGWHDGPRATVEAEGGVIHATVEPREYTLTEFLTLMNKDFKGWAADRPRTLQSWAYSLTEFASGK